MSIINDEKTTDELMETVGARLRQYRLRQNLTAAEVAERAGLSAATVINVENGRNPRLGSLIRLLRVLGRLEALEAFLPEPAVSPIQLARLKGRTRQRARKSQRASS